MKNNALRVAKQSKFLIHKRPRLMCPACKSGRLLDTGQFTHSELHVMESGDLWEADYYAKCPNQKCKADIGIRKIE